MVQTPTHSVGKHLGWSSFGAAFHFLFALGVKGHGCHGFQRRGLVMVRPVDGLERLGAERFGDLSHGFFRHLVHWIPSLVNPGSFSCVTQVSRGTNGFGNLLFVVPIRKKSERGEGVDINYEKDEDFEEFIDGEWLGDDHRRFVLALTFSFAYRDPLACEISIFAWVFEPQTDQPPSGTFSPWWTGRQALHQTHLANRQCQAQTRQRQASQRIPIVLVSW